jgi:hypothetical protein
MINERINDGFNRKPGEWFRRANVKFPDRGGAPKAEELRSRQWLRNIRKKWADRANEVLKLNGHQASMDHRTLAAQGIDREPQYHLGPAAAAMERKNCSKAKKYDSITAKGAEYNNQQEIAALEKEITALKMDKDKQSSRQISQTEIQNGRAEARANFERWKAEKEARAQDKKQIETENELKRRQEEQKKEQDKAKEGYSR